MLQPYQVLFDLVVSKGMTVGEAKEHISEELQSEHERTVSPERFVLCKKERKGYCIGRHESIIVEC